MVTRWFWIVTTAEFLFFAVMIVLVLTNKFRTGPEGPMGAIVLLVPPIVLAILGAIVWVSKSPNVTRACLILLALQAVPFIAGPIYQAITDYQTKRGAQGDDSFTGPQRALAHAIKAGESENRAKLENNRAFIPNFGERHRNQERISTAFVESTVNQVISKRMVKQQQMQWSKKGAHLMVQMRTKVLNNELEALFCRWYPSFRMAPSSAAQDQQTAA